MRRSLLVALAALPPLLMGFTGGCEESKPAPPIDPESGAVIKVEPGREGIEVITVRWPTGDVTRPRVKTGMCTVKPPHNTYPKCAER